MGKSKVIKISDEAYQILRDLSVQTEDSISNIASFLIINKNREIRFSERTVRDIWAV